MNLLITGAGGFVGARLARTLLERGTLAGQAIERLVLSDQAAPPADLLTDARVSAPMRRRRCKAWKGEASDLQAASPSSPAGAQGIARPGRVAARAHVSRSHPSRPAGPTGAARRPKTKDLDLNNRLIDC